jgi:SAM-dependent methyltransferase
VRPVADLGEHLLLCPNCMAPVSVEQSCPCGFGIRQVDGILDLMTSAEAAEFQPFIDVYDRIRRAEQWGGDDLDLPFRAKRHRAIWRIRRRTFRAFESIATKFKRGVGLDIGAGNCWMTRYLDRWGYDAIALDVNVSSMDGLRAGQKFIDEGARFLRIRAPMERLPFASGRITLTVTNASFHYAIDFRAALLEFRRVLSPGGMIVIIDTPFYESAADGERMMAQRVTEFSQMYGLPEQASRRSRFLTFKEMHELASSVNLKVKVQRVWPGFARSYERIRARVGGRRIAEFPLVVLEKP